MTLSPPIFDNVEINSSVIPSAKYSSLGSGLMFCNGNTATLSLSSVGFVEENAGGTKLFDRARSAGCKDSHYSFGYLLMAKPTINIGISWYRSFRQACHNQFSKNRPRSQILDQRNPRQRIHHLDIHRTASSGFRSKCVRAPATPQHTFQTNDDPMLNGRTNDTTH